MHLNLSKFQSKQLLKDGEKLQVLYVKDEEPFAEVNEFMEASRLEIVTWTPAPLTISHYNEYGSDAAVWYQSKKVIRI